LEFYLPQSKSKAETKEIILGLIKELKITNLSKQRGQIMGFIQSKYGEEIEGHIANKIIQEMLK
ncbi:MAG TPA: GatB/YqeY domain-containing protein, partial [Candidatus Absconditabacterales bacterium]|nr:GatB/YqeY domain-containing protein [Candidatus Absconditabacterales bacterium]